jgi:hypothetical protein
MNNGRQPPVPPPTIADLKAMGLTGAHVACTKCFRDRILTWAEISVPDATSFPQIASLRRFVCAACGAREYTMTPDWSAYRPQGGG